MTKDELIEKLTYSANTYTYGKLYKKTIFGVKEIVDAYWKGIDDTLLALGLIDKPGGEYVEGKKIIEFVNEEQNGN